MADALIDVGRQNRHTAGGPLTPGEGCWRDRGGRPCGLMPDPGSPSGMCRLCRDATLDQEPPR